MNSTIAFIDKVKTFLHKISTYFFTKSTLYSRVLKSTIMKNNPLFLALIALVTLSTSCKNDTEIPTSCTGIHWEYDGADGPLHWGELCTGYSDCAGTTQSPINIQNATADVTLTAIQVTYKPSTTHILFNGHTEYFSYDTLSPSTMTYGGVTYTLLQFHTHTQSEHRVSGTAYPMEIHLVHQNAATGKLAVVGLLVSEGAENATLQKFIPYLPVKKDSTYNAAATYNASSLIPTATGYYTYAGSLTTPPCSEIVTWLVMKTPILASTAQIQAFKNVEGANYRPVQSLNSRTLKAFN